MSWKTLSSTLASPNGWIDDGDNETLGNNVEAHLDNVFPWNEPEIPRPNGGMDPDRLFEFDLDLDQAPTTEEAEAFNQSSAVVNLFYWNNWMHDQLYELGFTEAAGNFQTDNFGRGGVGGDAVQADAQDGFGFNNANFSTPSGGDGSDPNPPRMQMYLFDGPDPDRDGDLDAEIILHEYTHGLSNRRVGGGPQLTALQSLGLGEGWSDFYALAFLSDEDDDLHGNYPIGGYVIYPFGTTGFEENYYFGIRRYPYTTDMDVNPLTFRDINPNEPNRPSANPNDPRRNLIFANTAHQPHNMGSVWCVALWDARANLINRYGFATGNDLMLRLVTDGMNLSPANPTFIQARDAILQADLVYSGGANLNELWVAFARRGMGWGAESPDNGTTTTIVESFALPPHGNQVWAGPFITEDAISGSPAIAEDGTIYVGSWDGTLYAINPDGISPWVYPPGGSILDLRGSPSVGPDGSVYIGCLDDRMYSISSSGALQWTYLTGGDIYSTPGFGADGTVYFGSRDGKVYALDPDTGQIRTGWPVTVGGAVDSSPAIAPDGTIYIGAQSSLYAFLPAGQVKSGWPKATGNTIWASPAIARDGTVYITSMDGKLYAFNPDGTTQWVYNAGSGIRSSPAIGPEGNIYFGTDGGTVYAVNSIGTGIWSQSAGFLIDSSPAVDAFGNVIIGSWNGVVYALRSADGGTLWSFSTGGLIQSPPTIYTNGVVYIGNGAGNLYALQNNAGPSHGDWSMFRQNPRHTGNPATLTLASGVVLGNLDFQFEIRGLSGMTCQIEGSDNLIAWNPLPDPFDPTLITLPAGGVATFTDDQASGYPYRFYRVRSGAILSYNSLGYVAVDVPSGYSMVANQLDNPAGNTVGVLLPDPPLWSNLYKWNETTQQYDINTFTFGGWNDPNMTLNPGEGVLVQPGAATAFTFIGDVRQGMLSNPFPTGNSIRSSMAPQTGEIDTALGFEPLVGDTIYRWNNASGGYDTYVYFPGGWDQEVIPRVGESFWIETGTGRTWTRGFAVW